MYYNIIYYTIFTNIYTNITIYIIIYVCAVHVHASARVCVYIHICQTKQNHTFSMHLLSIVPVQDLQVFFKTDFQKASN